MPAVEQPEGECARSALSLGETGFLEEAASTLGRDEILLACVGGGGMAPSIGDGEWVHVQRIAPAELRVGDVVLYRSLSNTAVIHRIVKIEEAEGTTARMITQGDACQIANAPVPVDRVCGRLIAVERHGHVVSLDTPAMGLREQLRAIFSRNQPSSGKARES